MLLAAGSNVHLKSDEGYTALDAAIHHKHPSSPSSRTTLLSKGAVFVLAPTFGL